MGTHQVYRSAVTGRFVTAAYAAAHPKTTYRDTVPNKTGPDPDQEELWTTSSTSASAPSSP